jgi:para-aminobenzoate synthetase component 1
LRRGGCGFYFETAGPQDRYGTLVRGVAIGAAAPQITRLEDFLYALKNPSSPIFGIVGYDAKNFLEPILPSPRALLFEAPEVSLFHATETHYEHGRYAPISWPALPPPTLPVFEPLISKERYLDSVVRLIEHIRCGDVYEINYTFPFCAWAPSGFDPLEYYERRVSFVPFSCYYFDGVRAVICFSPERFLKKSGNTYLSQPIKGTLPSFSDAALDAKQRRRLKRGIKFRAENTMIVDLSRNDFHRFCRPESVRVERWCEIQRFPSLYHSVSTIIGEAEEGCDSDKAFGAVFPPGSMTGAPKVRAMELIDAYEEYSRGWYSGAAGYVNGNGDFDFNVLIRSLFFHAGRLYFHVGGALTIDSDPEAEYEECMVKARSFAEVR